MYNVKQKSYKVTEEYYIIKIVQYNCKAYLEESGIFINFEAVNMCVVTNVSS